ncbi:FecCD family ABC transporter permease [Yinghuangia soli]|uniref:Iron chelate uptake ABC transporter family permease subunit n=1 Tax=Yinghuangia soli TaxID=2908204 RepID=A0AA41U6Z5_9ACTN|nr:iron chelate uptake ABC transporter family permease subunit [Yinghuangia soli]MCF2533537.1 iron chelate uptake ABC transporter family permease subunit [Yinghuangia soli]
MTATAPAPGPPAESRAAPGAPGDAPKAPPGLRGRRQAAALATALLLLALAAALSIAVGARSIPLDRVWSLLVDRDTSTDAAVVHDLRLPRTLLGMLVGAALGAAGALMQAVTRNPLADPGLLGVNAGAALAMAAGFSALADNSTAAQLRWAFLGAAAATVLVYALGTGRRTAATPVRLVLAGAAVSAAALALVQAMILLDPIALDRFRFWAVGSLAGRETGVLAAVWLPIATGLLMAFALTRPLNALALGEDAARALGTRPGLVRGLALVAVVLLCGAATAAAGPLSFVGLVAPHLARRFAGADQRRVMAWSVLLAPLLLLASDVAGRVLARPGEVQVGVVCAFLGGPVLIALTRRAPGLAR